MKLYDFIQPFITGEDFCNVKIYCKEHIYTPKERTDDYELVFDGLAWDAPAGYMDCEVYTCGFAEDGKSHEILVY
jgi:hypothetical protein